MLRNYLTVAFRNLTRQWGHSLIHVVGLAIGIACCLLIGLVVHYEVGFDRFHAKGERIHRLLLEDTSGKTGLPGTLLPADLAAVVQETVSGVRAASGYIQGEGSAGEGREKVGVAVALADPAFLEMFSFPLLAGDAAAALATPDGAVVSQGLVEKVLGLSAGSAVGHRIRINDRDHIVQAVIADVPRRSSLQFECLLPLEERSRFGVDRNNVGETTVFVEVAPDASRADVQAALSRLIHTSLREPLKGKLGDSFSEGRLSDFRLRLQSLGEIHFDNGVESHYVRLADPSAAWVLSGMAGLVLLVACINFTTLSLGSAPRRGREVGVRKVVGARRRQLIWQFWGETALVCALAALLGIGLTRTALPTFSRLMGVRVSLAQLGDWQGLVFLGAMVMLTVLTAGGYPALVLSRQRPVAILGRRGDAGRGGGPRFLRWLLVAQYAFGIGITVCALVVAQQLRFVSAADLGYDPEDVLTVWVPGAGAARRFEAAAGALPSVASVTASDRAFTTGSYTIGLQGDDGHWGAIRMLRVDEGYLRTLKIDLVAGRDLDLERPSDRKHAALVNESTIRRLGWADPIGRVLPVSDVNDTPHPTIVGVVRDFHFDSMHRSIQPLFLTLNPDYHGLNYVLIRIRPEARDQAQAQLAEAWARTVPDEPFEATWLAERLSAQYRDEATWSRLLGAAAGFVVFIACMGLLGHVALAVARRTKELGIRKVLGASPAGLLSLLGRESLAVVVVASAVGWMAAWWAMERWLTGYAYRIELGPTPFAAASGAAAALAAAVVLVQSAAAVLRSPVDALRHE